MKSTKYYGDLDQILAYRNVYETLIENGLPLIAGAKNKEAKRNTEFKKLC